MVQQVEFSLTPKRKGFHLVTQEIMKNLPTLPEQGILNLFVKHTSCALSINENYDPSVRSDMEQIYNRLVKTNEPYYSHTDEGEDDMPSHAKSSLDRSLNNHPDYKRTAKPGNMARNLPLRIQIFRRST